MRAALDVIRILALGVGVIAAAVGVAYAIVGGGISVLLRCLVVAAAFLISGLARRIRGGVRFDRAVVEQ